MVGASLKLLTYNKHSQNSWNTKNIMKYLTYMDWIFYGLQSDDFFLKNEAPDQIFITDKNKIVADKVKSLACFTIRNRLNWFPNLIF